MRCILIFEGGMSNKTLFSCLFLEIKNTYCLHCGDVENFDEMKE